MPDSGKDEHEKHKVISTTSTAGVQYEYSGNLSWLDKYSHRQHLTFALYTFVISFTVL